MENEKFALTKKIFRQINSCNYISLVGTLLSRFGQKGVRHSVKINFGESRRSKTAVFGILGALNFANLVICSL